MMNTDERATEYVKRFYDEPQDLLECYEAYKDGFRDGTEHKSWKATVALMILGAAIMILLLALIDTVTNHAIFKF